MTDTPYTLPLLPRRTPPPACRRCIYAIRPGQAFLPAKGSHVACPTAGEVARAARWGRQP